MKRLLAALFVALLASACDDDGGCPELEEELDCVDWCSGMMTGAVCRDGEWVCSDDCHPCLLLHPGEVCAGDRVICDPPAEALSECPELLCRSCEGWAGPLEANGCTCACDGAAGQVLCVTAG